MTERQKTMLDDLATALTTAARMAHGIETFTPAVEVARLRRVERAAVSLSACAGVPRHWTADEREGLLYLREALHGPVRPEGTVALEEA